MTSLLHDRRAFAVVLTHDDERATRHATRSEVRQGVGGNVGAHRGLEGDCAAQRVVDRGRQGRGRGGLTRAVLEADAVVREDVLCIRQHVHQVRDWRALVARHVRHARFQQGLGDSEDALAAENLALAEPKLLHLFHK
ncbi:hypothetical protein D3C71_1730790 [compost metagenome]